MATISRKNKGWRAQVRRKDVNKSRTFRTKAEAQKWAFEQEEMIINQLNDSTPDLPVAWLIDRYIREVSIKKRSYKGEKLRFLRLLDHPVAKINLRELKADDFLEWRRERLEQVRVASVQREWNSISSMFSHAVREWRIFKENPLKNIKTLPQPKPRTRRYSDLEIRGLIRESGFKWDEPPTSTLARVGIAILFAIETAMRAGEIIGLTWGNVHFEDRIAHLPMTKNGYSRDVPLSSKALELLRKLEEIKADDKPVFQLTSGTLDNYFRQLKAKLFIQDLHFHDTRREALTRLAAKVDVMTLAKISGHRDLSILQNTYYAPDMKRVANLLG